MADDRDRKRAAEDDAAGGTGVGDPVGDVADPNKATDDEERDEGPQVSDEEGLP